MNKFVIVIILSFNTFFVFAQTNDEYFSDSYKSKDSTFYKEFKKEYKPQKLNLNVELGTGVGSNLKGGNYITTYVAPRLSYDLTPKFKINGGIKIANTTMNDFAYYNYLEGVQKMNGNILQTTIFLQGTYQLSKRLTISGTGIYEMASFDSYENKKNSYNFDGKGMAVGFNYKLSENSSIGIELQMSKGLSPYHNAYGCGTSFMTPSLRSW